MYEEYFKHLLANRSLIIKSSLFLAILGIVISLFLNNYYRASSVISPTRDNYAAEDSSQLGAIAQSIGFGANEATPELKFAKSYFGSYKFNAEFIANEDIIPELILFKDYNKKKDTFIYSGNPDDYRITALFPEGEINYSSKYFQSAVKELRKFVRLSPGRENDPAMYLTVTHRSPTFAYRINSRILSFLNQAIIEIDIKDSDAKLEYIKSIVPNYTQVEVRTVLSSIIERELTKKVLANSLTEYSFMILDPPVLPIYKFSPRRSIIVITFLLSGLLLSIIYLTFTYGFTLKRKEKENEKVL
tara:strand:+ start:330 stop:1235 length:906 start_codon:yes stop_codon:yes gene_type:complete